MIYIYLIILRIFNNYYDVIRLNNLQRFRINKLVDLFKIVKYVLNFNFRILY